jgi:hypothetical protein
MRKIYSFDNTEKDKGSSDYFRRFSKITMFLSTTRDTGALRMAPPIQRTIQFTHEVSGYTSEPPGSPPPTGHTSKLP